MAKKLVVNCTTGEQSLVDVDPGEVVAIVVATPEDRGKSLKDRAKSARTVKDLANLIYDMLGGDDEEAG